MSPPRRTRSRYWRQIAIAADRQPRTRYAIAKEIGTDGGALQSAFESMCSDGILRAKSGARGQTYSLTAKGRRLLAETDRAIDARKAVPGGARVLLVVDEGRAIAPDLLAELAAEPTLAWSLRLDGIVRWLAVFESDDATPVDRVAARVEAAGARPIVGRADAIFNADELLDYASQIGVRRALPA
jgi:DNA-binding PadR family transcriptional regulator